VGDPPERVRNASCHLRGHEKRFGCCRLKGNSCYDLNRQELRSSCCCLTSAPVSSTTSPRTREAHCGARVPVGDVEGDRSGCGDTEYAQPPTRDIDACSDGSASVTLLLRLSVFSSVRSSSGVKLREVGEVIQQDSQCRRNSLFKTVDAIMRTTVHFPGKSWRALYFRDTSIGGFALSALFYPCSVRVGT
jgi:hypothetical protein